MTPTITYDPFSIEVQANPYPSYARLRRGSPVHYVESLDAFAVSRHDDVRRVMQDHRTFSSEAMAALVARPFEYSTGDAAEQSQFEGDGAISIVGTDGDTHTRLRTIVNRGFTPRRMAAQERDIRSIARSFVEQLARDGGGELQSMFAIPFPTAVIASLLGIDADRRD